MVKEGILQ